MATTNESVFREVLDASSDSVASSQAAIRKHFTDDCVWRQSGLPTTTGPEEAAALLDSLVDSIGLLTLDVEYLYVASNEDVVFTERVDWMVNKDGRRFGPRSSSESPSFETARSVLGASTSIPAD